MPLSEEQKIRFAFDFTVSNSSTQYIDYRSGDEEKFGLNTSVFPNLENTVDLINLSESSARTLHQKLVWDKYHINDIKDVEIATKVYDLFFIFPESEVRSLVRDSLLEVLQKQPRYEKFKFGRKEISLINEISELGRGQKFLDTLISLSLTKVNSQSLEKRIEKKPTVN